jgi:hypothetical protein
VAFGLVPKAEIQGHDFDLVKPSLTMQTDAINDSPGARSCLG